MQTVLAPPPFAAGGVEVARPPQQRVAVRVSQALVAPGSVYARYPALVALPDPEQRRRTHVTSTNGFRSVVPVLCAAIAIRVANRRGVAGTLGPDACRVKRPHTGMPERLLPTRVPKSLKVLPSIK